MVIPKPVQDKLNELNALCEKYPVDIPVTVCAEFLGMDKDCLRRAIEIGSCRFGIGGNNGPYGNRFFKIPTFVFYLWCRPDNPINFSQGG